MVNGEPMLPVAYVNALEDELRGQMRDKADLRGYMATVNELWENIPERKLEMPYAVSPDCFRKHALIKTGWAQTQSIVFETPDHARRAAANIGYMARMGHGYAITVVRENVVVCTNPLTQSVAGMGKEDFRESKSQVLDYLRGLIGITGEILPSPASNERMGVIARMRCIICEVHGEEQISGTQVHHCICGRYSMRRVQHAATIPLCEGHHQGLRDTSKFAIHQSKEAWVALYGEDTDYLRIVNDKMKTQRLAA